MLQYAYSFLHVQDILKVFRALSDETRLRIISLLLERECSVCEVMQATRISQTRASRGLTALRNAGILKVRREGLWVLYSIDEEGMEESYDCLPKLIRSTLKGNELVDLDRERLKAAVRESPCSERVKLLSS
jgi:ArsR family transcriptional regulator